MAVWTREINTDFNFPNINILNVLKDGVLSNYEAVPQDGYVMYDTTDENYDLQRDENGNIVFDENGNPIEIPVTYYYTIVGIPKTFNFNNFTWVAVLRSTVDENYIFGGGNTEPDHEIM